VSGVEPDLRQLLDELHAAIERTQDGQEDREELTRLVDAVERRLRDDEDAERHGHLLDALHEAELRFEADHPVLGAAIRRAIDTLSAAGI
jgi:regulator of sirC expression with transglutaminase-like and TPR domain